MLVIKKKQLINTDGRNRVAPDMTMVQMIIILETVDFHCTFVEPAMKELILR